MTESGLRESDDSEIGEDEYQVERIVKVRIRGGKKEYFLKWKGYSEEENTWEPEENLDCPDLIKDFEERMAKERSATTSPARSSYGSNKSIMRSKSLGVSELPRKRGRSSLNDHDDSAPEAKKPADETTISVSKVPSRSLRGFARGLEPDRIIGATDSSGELMFLIKWKSCNEADLVPAREANLKCPQTVIRFYEERLTWHTPEPRAEPFQVAAVPASSTTPQATQTTVTSVDSSLHQSVAAATATETDSVCESAEASRLSTEQSAGTPAPDSSAAPSDPAAAV
ncbi:unnamed protein product [Mesocestoides corti]|uniref:Chromo domain-containing protein n=1 Tax=Mesocestoides corti TaxID=53468 RepID=A0A0R3U7H0_MESCO|nr:unnamed protein product [Mesocestoides corti]